MGRTTADEVVNTFLRQMRQRWEERARLHHRYFTESVHFDDGEAWDRQADYEADRFVGGLDPERMKRMALLEVGCGPARLLSRLAPRFHRAVGLDISPTMLARAHELSAGFPNTLLVLAAGDGLACVRDDGFDLVIMHAVAIHMPLPLIEHYMQEVCRVLRPGGRFRFTLHRKAEEAAEKAAVAEFMLEAVREIPVGAEDLVHGADYSGHRFADDELESFLGGLPFAGFRHEAVGLETVAVDAWL